MEKLDDFKHFLQLHNKLPVTLLHLVSEPVFQSIDGLPADLQGARHTGQTQQNVTNKCPRRGGGPVCPQTLVITERAKAVLLGESGRGTWQALAVGSFPTQAAL